MAVGAGERLDKVLAAVKRLADGRLCTNGPMQHAVAAALANPFDDWSETESLPPLPDVREEEGWVYSSTPTAVRRTGRSYVIERSRQAVSPSGEMTEEESAIELDSLSAEELEAEAADAGFSVLPRRTVPETREYVGSDVAVLEAA